LLRVSSLTINDPDNSIRYESGVRLRFKLRISEHDSTTSFPESTIAKYSSPSSNLSYPHPVI
jgi:hypothetical protein